MSGEAVGWRTVRVFISSTFRDMQAERDHLVRFVFSRLREELLHRRIHLVDVDLRWGVTAEQDALEVCREIIDECRPRFVCILGGRYGWTPPGRERSITADEVHYAALDSLDREEYRFFYFRDPAATASVPEELAAEYREPPGSEAEAKLLRLKQQVREAGLPVYEYHATWAHDKGRLVGLEAFGEAVYRDLMASIDDEFGSQPPVEPDWFAEENAATEAFIEERTERYVVGSRQALLEELAAHAEGTGEPSVLVVTGEPGSGKSALLGRFCRDYAAAHPDAIVIPHFVGASAGSTSIQHTLRRLCHELAEAAGIEEQIPRKIRELTRAFPRLLQAAARAGRVVLVIDALNQLDAAHNAHALRWLPRTLPEGVRVICSSLEHRALKTLRRRRQQVREAVSGPLTEADAAAIMDGFLARYHKRLAADQRAALLTKADAGNPLYLLAALEELRTLGTYERITARIRELPGTVTELFDWILRRLAEGVEGQEAFGERLVRAYTSYIAIGRGGVLERDLVELCQPVDAEGEFWVLHRMLRPYLMRRGPLVDYFHGQLRAAVERRWLADEASRRRRHREMAMHLTGRLEHHMLARGLQYDRARSEAAYHVSLAEWAPGGEHADELAVRIAGGLLFWAAWAVVLWTWLAGRFGLDLLAVSTWAVIAAYPVMLLLLAGFALPGLKRRERLLVLPAAVGITLILGIVALACAPVDMLWRAVAGASIPMRWDFFVAKSVVAAATVPSLMVEAFYWPRLFGAVQTPLVWGGALALILLSPAVFCAAALPVALAVLGLVASGRAVMGLKKPKWDA
ncbi:MAG: DUF4062 domain-containing protein [Armatimonadota bacterium]